MTLHKDKEVFKIIIEHIEAIAGIDAAIIEKDYFVTMFLQKLTKRLPSMIFKGGTSLSLCYNVIKRFSEDIDITVDFEDSLTQRQYKEIKQAVVDVVKALDLEILNLEDTRSRRDFNQYKIAYPAEFSLLGMKQFLFVETSVSVRSFPTEVRQVRSMIQEFSEGQNLARYDIKNLRKKYNLEAFPVRTQGLDRTLIDKLFALGDYYLTSQEAGHSRHIYDIYKLMPLVKIDDNFRALVKEVREVRKESKY